MTVLTAAPSWGGVETAAARVDAGDGRMGMRGRDGGAATADGGGEAECHSER